jgi:3'-5' exonuclease
MSIENITFIDIETVSQYQSFKDAPESVQSIFQKRFSGQKSLLPVNGSGDLVDYAQVFYMEKAGLYAEFSKVVCVSVGKMKAGKFWIRSISSRDELHILKGLSETLEKSTFLCAHNGKEFDYPYLMRRYIINAMPIPPLLNTFGKKPWEVLLEDTMVMWSGTQWNYKVSLDLLCSVLGVKSPKIELTGGNVHEIYHGMFEVDSDALPFDKEQVALDTISKYCSGDVLAMANCYNKMKGYPLIENVEYVKYEPNEKKS